MRLPWATWSLLSIATLTLASPYRDDLVQYNLNVNQNAQSPLDYQTSRQNTTYTPSPTNWRAVPFYTVLMDKFADGDPSNNDYFGTMFEYDWRETQLRAGGDLKGLVSKLDYLYGMGIRGIFISGTPFINMIWQADSKCFLLNLFHLPCIKLVPGYSPLDFSVLDPHWGTLDDWRNTIDTIHAHNMYIMLDFTVGTMGDLIGFAGCVMIDLPYIISFTSSRFLNTSATFSLNEHDAVWKHPKYAPWGFDEYQDFQARDAPRVPEDLAVLTSCTRLIILATRLVYSQSSGVMMARSSLCKLMGAWSQTLINTATQKLSVSIQIGNVSYPSLRPYKIVFVNGSPASWPSYRFFLAWSFKLLI